MRKGLVVTVLAGIFATSCAHGKHGTGPNFYVPLSLGIEYCLGESTPSPKDDKRLQSNELYNCARELYTWAQESCSEGEHREAQEFLKQASQNLEALPKEEKASIDYNYLMNQIDLLNAGINQQTHCR